MDKEEKIIIATLAFHSQKNNIGRKSVSKGLGYNTNNRRNTPPN